MKNKMLGFLLGIFLLLGIAGSASAATLSLHDWQFNPLGTGLTSVFQPIDEITLLGTSLVQNAAVPAPGVAFSEIGAFAATAFQNGGSVIPVTTTFLNFNYELTAVFTAIGVNTTAVGSVQNFDFLTGTLDIYIDTTMDFGFASATDFFGADDGIHIASFLLDYGTGDLDLNTPAGIDGQIDIQFSANLAKLINGFAPGYWFDVDGIDFSTYTLPNIALGLVDGNNNVLEAADFAGTNIISEFGVAPNFPVDFYTRTDGSFQPGVVPEPTTFLLLGGGLMGLGFLARRRKKRN